MGIDGAYNMVLSNFRPTRYDCVECDHEWIEGEVTAGPQQRSFEAGTRFEMG